MKHVGILTWYFGANYGALAQSVAMYQTINSLGYEARMINYKPDGYGTIALRSNIPPRGKRLLRLKDTINGIIKYKNLTAGKYLMETETVTGSDDINKLNLDCVVLGSDAIFNTDHPLWTPIYYGVGIKLKKITYSPSCEYLPENTILSTECIDSLKEMTSISVRDVNSRKLIEYNAGIIPEITLDPTFLYDFSKFDKNFVQGDYILIYSFSDWSQYQKQLMSYAKANSLAIVAIGSEVKWADYSFPSASFEEWIAAFRNANMVITDSFHGTVFSLKNNKQIILCGRKDKQSKIYSLLEQVGASLNVYQGENIDQYLSNNLINYGIVSGNIKYETKKSLFYLTEALKIATSK